MATTGAGVAPACGAGVTFVVEKAGDALACGDTGNAGSPLEEKRSTVTTDPTLAPQRHDRPIPRASVIRRPDDAVGMPDVDGEPPIGARAGMSMRYDAWSCASSSPHVPKMIHRPPRVYPSSRVRVELAADGAALVLGAKSVHGTPCDALERVAAGRVDGK